MAKLAIVKIFQEIKYVFFTQQLPIYVVFAI